MRSWLKILGASLILALGINYVARSDYTMTQGVGTTVFAFTCFVTKVCPATTLVNSSGTEVGTSGNPFAVSSGVAQASNTNGQTVSPIGCRTLAAAPSPVDTTAQTNMPRCDTLGNTMVAPSNLDPCNRFPQSFTPINLNTVISTNIVAASAGNKTYICQLFLITNAANPTAIVEGTGDTCGSGTVGVIGGPATPTGLPFGANSGVSLGNGMSTIAQTAGTNVNLCIIPGVATQLSGGIRYVRAP